MRVYRAFFSIVRTKYSIASTGTDSTQELNVAAVSGGDFLAWICAEDS